MSEIEPSPWNAAERRDGRTALGVVAVLLIVFCSLWVLGAVFQHVGMVPYYIERAGDPI